VNIEGGGRGLRIGVKTWVENGDKRGVEGNGYTVVNKQIAEPLL
jgi:hypothetical protein